MAAFFPFLHKQGGGTAPSELAVFGERNSGTNLVHALLARNISAFADSPGDRIGKFGFRYGWKHGFPQMLAAPDAALAVAVFRAPETWLRSMHARPWHAMPALKDLPFEAFIRAEWQSRVDEKNFGVDDGDARALVELQWDRHPLTGARFGNILALRTAKSAGYLSLPQRFRHCVLVRFEDVQADPQGFVACVAALYGLDRASDFVPVEERRGKPGDGAFQPASYAALSDADRAFVWAELDEAQEQRLGYARP